MKIAFLSFYSGVVNRGAETFVKELSQRLKKRYSTKICSEKNPSAFVKYRFGWRFFLDSQSLAIKSFTDKVLRGIDEDTDILIPIDGGWQALACKLWAVRHQAKVVISGQSGPGWDDRINLLCRPDIFVALTEYQKWWARRNSFDVRVEKIPNGVDTNKFSSRVEPARLDLPRPVFLCVAGLESDKRIDLTINAVAACGQGSLLVIGDGTERDDLKYLGENLWPGRVKFLQAKHEEMPRFFAAADIFTMVPVASESFGIVYLEAMATGLPVVATDDPIRQEIIGDGGLFVDPKNTEEYAAALQKALDTDWGNKPRLQAEKFSWDKIIAEYENLFRSFSK